MDTAQPLEVKVVYSSSKQHRVRRTPRAGRPAGNSRLVVLGLLNLSVAGAVYFGTCWWADRELRVVLLLHTPLTWIDVEEAASFLPGSQTLPSHSRPAGVTPESVEETVTGSGSEAPREEPQGETGRPELFVGTAVGWEVLSVLSACALAFSGGALLSRGGRSLRIAGIVVGVVGLGVVGWQAYELWQRYASFAPDQQRLDIGGLVLLFALIGVASGWGVRGWTFLAGILLIVAAAGSSFGLYIGRQYGAFDFTGLPLSFPVLLVVVFAIHSLWGWILLPLAARIRR